MAKLFAVVTLVFGLILSVLLALSALSIYHGFVFSVLWGWFIVPLGVKPIGALSSIGLMLTANLLKINLQTNDKNAVSTAVVAPALILLLGYIVKSIIGGV
jgi:hypothetical protein